MLRTPPDVLITTPESLYLMLTSQAREFLVGRRVGDRRRDPRRGPHQARRPPRADARAARARWPGTPLQRIGLSATQRPLEEVGRFLVGARPRLQDRRRRRAQAARPEDPRAGRGHARAGRPRRHRPGRRRHGHRGGRRRPDRHRARRRARRPALDLAGDLPRAARAGARAPLDDHLRQQPPRRRAAGGAAERAGRGGRRTSRPTSPAPTTARSPARSGWWSRTCSSRASCPAWWPPRSLELGIDMGAVDLVIQVESPKSVTAGPAAHRPRRPRRRRGLARAHLPQVPRRPARVRRGRQAHARRRHRADRRAAQPARRARPADRGDDRDRRRVEGARAARAGAPRLPVRRAVARAARPRARHARRALPVRGVRRAAPAHRLGPRGGHDPRAQGRAASWRSPTPARSPTAASTACTCPTAAAWASSTRRWSTRRGPGQTFLLGASTWRIEEITRDRVIVTPAPGRAGRGARSGAATASAARRSSGEAIGAFAREAVDREPAELAAEYDLDERAARNLSAFLREQRDATRVVPSDRTIVIERFRDEIGDWRLCVLSPYGGRVHAAWALALSARIRDEFGLESDAIWSDDGIIVHLPDADEPPAADLVLVEPDELEELVVRELSGSALFGARFRENAARALLLPRARPGQAHAALAAAAEGAVAARGGQALRPVPDRARDLPRVPARRASTCPGSRSCCAGCTRASCRSSRSRPSAPRRSPRRCCSTTSPPTCTRATRPTPSGARRRCRSTATCCASCSARRSCAS